MNSPSPPSPRSDEESLVAALQAGDDAAFEQVVREQAGRLLAVARRILRQEQDAEEVVQEAFLTLHQKVASLRGEARVSTWLHRVVVNGALMRIRRKKARPEDSIEDLLPGFLEDGHHDHDYRPWKDPAEAFEETEARSLVREHLDRLPENYRTVLLLRDIEELNTREAAEALEISENAVKVRLHRARVALRALLEETMQSPETAA